MFGIIAIVLFCLYEVQCIHVSACGSENSKLNCINNCDKVVLKAKTQPGAWFEDKTSYFCKQTLPSVCVMTRSKCYVIGEFLHLYYKAETEILYCT